ncbi:MAG: TPM domain-containing protein [Candidatus Marinimicrobia bacterium]|nr:TPM domain-containing protein [Candidatus Neomarinimicrobiota bacterium]
MSKKFLNKNDVKRIGEAVKNAEKNTSGEIATAFINESDDYAKYELFFAFIVGFVYFAIMLMFSGKIESTIQNLFWNYNSNYLVMFYGLSIFVIIAIFYFIANISSIDRLIVPKKVMKEKVKNRAIRHFMESGVYKTRDRTGILIFISLLEHRIELIADSGINEKITQEKWDDIVIHIVNGVKGKKLANNLIEAIDECGKLLSKYFPIKEDDENELENEINILEK